MTDCMNAVSQPVIDTFMHVYMYIFKAHSGFEYVHIYMHECSQSVVDTSKPECAIRQISCVCMYVCMYVESDSQSVIYTSKPECAIPDDNHAYTYTYKYIHALYIYVYAYIHIYTHIHTRITCGY